MSAVTVNTDLKLRKAVLTKFRDSGFAAFTDQECLAIDQRLAAQPDDPLAHLYRSFVLWSSGDLENGSKALLRCRDLVSGTRECLIGIEIGANSWMPDAFGSADPSALIEPDSLSFLRTCERSDAQLTILLCADEKYFQRFYAAILAAVHNVYNPFIVHLHLLNPSEHSIDLLRHLDCSHLSVSIEYTLQNQSHKAYYASSRFMIGRMIMKRYDTHLLTTDVDVFPSANFQAVLREVIASGVDLSCGRNFHSWMPWNTHIVTKCFFRNNACGRSILATMSAYIRFVAEKVGSYEHLWWIDQNAMHLAIAQQQDSDLAFRPIASFGQLFVGPEKIGKDHFAAIMKRFFDASERYRPVVDGLFPAAFKEYGSDLLKDEPLLGSLLTQTLKTRSSNVESWLQFLLPLHLVGALNLSTFDGLLACAIRAGAFDLVAAFVLQGKQAKTVLLQLPSTDTSSGTDQAIEVIAPLLARHKHFAALEQLAACYQSADPQTLQHFRAGEVRALLKSGLVAQAKASLQEHFQHGILVGGIQRSGTNYLAELLRSAGHIFTTYTDDNNLVFWKHALPNETQKHRCNPKFKSPVDALRALDLHCVILYKMPLNWLDSILNRFPADFFDSRPGYVKGQQDYAGMMKFYALYLNRWREASLETGGRLITLMNYERLLANPDRELQRLPAFSSSIRTNQPLDLAYSRGFAKRSSSQQDRDVALQLPKEAVQEAELILKTRLAWMET